MGLFDYLRCNYPLEVEGANKLLYQTEDTPRQFMDQYEITQDGYLKYEEYDTEDRSDLGASGVWKIVGMMTAVNKRWVEQPNFTGEIRFYTSWVNGFSHFYDQNIYEDEGWVEFSAYFKNGVLREINLLENRPKKMKDGPWKT